jgi:ATP-binding cassette subfamily B protein
MKAFTFAVEIIRRYPRKFIVSICLLFFLNVTEMAAILSIAPVVDYITSPDLSSASTITRNLIKILQFLHLPSGIFSIISIMICFTFVRALVQILVYSSVLKIKFELMKDLICSTFQDFVNARWLFFTTRTQGILGNTIIKECVKVSDYFAHMGMIVVKTFQVIFYCAISFWVSWKLAFFIVIPGIICLIPFSLLGKITYRLGQNYIAMSNRTFQIIQESLAAVKIVIGFDKQKTSTEALSKAMDQYVAAEMKSQIMNTGTPILFQPIAIAIILYSIVISQKLFQTPLSDMTVILYAFYLAIPQFGQIIGIKNILLNIIPSFDQVNCLRKEAQQEAQPSGTKRFNSLEKSIVFKNVSFTYPGGDRVLNDINIEIQKGKMVAFVGKSGAGKSTLIDLLLRFFEAEAGTIIIDDIDIKKLDIHTLREKIGYVSQESILFNMTVRENILWARENATEDEIEKACKAAYIDEFLKDLPNGLDTRVGDRGVCLSGGQRQRIALARSLIRNPELLILDEATSSLDSISEQLIQQAIENIARETTVVVVAHRLSTVVCADYIYVLDEGRIAEEGNFADLCARQGVCYEMAKVQGMV